MFEILNSANKKHWEYGLSICAIYATANGVYIGGRLKELYIAGKKNVRQQSFMQYDLKGNKLQDNNKGKNDIITSVNTIS